MSAIVWAVETFGQLGGALVLIAAMIIMTFVARYAFWSIVVMVVAYHVRQNCGIDPEEVSDR